MLYRKYSQYLKECYGEKVYKLPVNLPITCPNRDGTIGTGGCYFCSELGTGFESQSSLLSVEEQLKTNMAYIGKRYGAKLFSAYFQNYTNTHMPFDQFREAMTAACIEQIVEIVVSTRPDCISEAYLEFLKELSESNGVRISIELGLQTTNEKSLILINRGHGVASFIEAVRMIKGYGFSICTHLILNLPWDEPEEVLKMAELMNQLEVEQVKLHSLYIAKGTRLETMYLKGEFMLWSKEDYIARVVCFLEHLSPNTVIQRLIGRIPKEETCFCNWNTSWWKIHDEIMERMQRENTYQGKYYSQAHI